MLVQLSEIATEASTTAGAVNTIIDDQRLQRYTDWAGRACVNSVDAALLMAILGGEQ